MRTITRTMLLSFFILCSATSVSCSAKTPPQGHHSAKMAYRKAPRLPSKITVYYLSFDASTFAALDSGDLRAHAAKMIVTDQNTIADIYSFFSSAGRGRASRFDTEVPRLLIEPAGRREKILVDQEGNILLGRRQFALKPLAYLRLYLLLKGLFPDTDSFPGHTSSK